PPQIGEYLAIGGREEFKTSPSKDAKQFSERDHVAHPIQEGRWITLLSFHVERFVTPHCIHDDGAIEFGGIGAAESRVAIGIPLHGSADPVAIAEINVVAHSDFIAVVNDRG